VWEFHPVFDAVCTHLVNQKKESNFLISSFKRGLVSPYSPNLDPHIKNNSFERDV
jgi:hypothetical protein